MEVALNKMERETREMVVYLPKKMWHEEHQCQYHRVPDAHIAQQAEVGEQHKAHHQYAHILAVQHGGDGEGDACSQQPPLGRLVCLAHSHPDVLFIQVKKQGRKEQQRGVGRRNNAVGHEQRHGRRDDAELHSGAGRVPLLFIKGFPYKPKRAPVQQGREETDAQDAIKKEAAAMCEQRHHRRVVVIAPCEMRPIERVVRLVGMEAREQGGHKVCTDPDGQKKAESFLFRLHATDVIRCQKTLNFSLALQPLEHVALDAGGRVAVVGGHELLA